MLAATGFLNSQRNNKREGEKKERRKKKLVSHYFWFTAGHLLSSLELCCLHVAETVESGLVFIVEKTVKRMS